MAEAMMLKTQQGFVPHDDESRDLISKVKLGNVVRVKFTQPRNVKFHRKLFALLDVGFEAFEPEEQEFRGLPVQKNRERFRKDCIIAAGYYEPVVNLKGEVRAEAKSISFARMDEDEFSALYSAIVDVLLQRVLRNYTREDVDRVVEEIVGFV